MAKKDIKVQENELLKKEHEIEIISLLHDAKPGIAIRKCIEYGFSVEEWGNILRRGIRKEIWGHDQVTLCYGIVWHKKRLPT